jgi:hypothetical protein
MKETLESYRRTKNMLKDLSKNLKPEKRMSSRSPHETTDKLT